MKSFNTFLFLKLLLIYVLQVSCENEKDLPCKFSESINITSGKLKHKDGSILHNNLLYKPENYARISYTADNYGIIPVKNAYYRGCICQVKSCVRFCCEYFEDVDGVPTCTDTEITELLVEVEADESESKVEMDLIRSDSFHLAPSSINYTWYRIERGEWILKRNGFVFSKESNLKISQELYCLLESWTLSNKMDDTNVEIDSVTVTHIAALIISLPFMLVTLLIYLCISELRNLHGKCLICYVFSMFVCFSLLIISKLSVKLPFCYYYQYFWTMAGFFWLNVLCFDIFWTFSSGVVKQNERKKFWYYSLYAWSCPMILLALLVVIDKTSFVPENYRPQIQDDYCFFGGDESIPLIYLYSILLLLILANILFFVITLTRIIGIQRSTDAVLQRGSRRHSSVENRYRIHLYLRLFVVMGVMWIFEVISYTVCPETSCMPGTDVINCLLGVFIFLMFVCKSNVKQMILKRISKKTSLSRSKSNHTISTSVTLTRDACIPLRQLSRTESYPEKYSNDTRYY